LGAKNRALHIQFKVYPNCNTPVFLEFPPLVTIVWISKTVRFVARRRHVLDVAIGFILPKGGQGDALYQHFLVTAERTFWRCVLTGEMPRPYGIEPPRPRVEAVRVVDMSESKSWAEFAGLFCATRSAFLDHERAKTELKALMPEDAKEAAGHGVRAKRSKSGAVSFELLAQEESRAEV
jgi:hypothetical protein